jgi:hypothetical protein
MLPVVIFRAADRASYSTKPGFGLGKETDASFRVNRSSISIDAERSSTANMKSIKGKM